MRPSSWLGASEGKPEHYWVPSYHSFAHQTAIARRLSLHSLCFISIVDSAAASSTCLLCSPRTRSERTSGYSGKCHVSVKAAGMVWSCTTRILGMVPYQVMSCTSYVLYLSTLRYSTRRTLCDRGSSKGLLTTRVPVRPRRAADTQERLLSKAVTVTVPAHIPCKEFSSLH